VKLLLIDNYDSYAYNLFQLLAEVGSERPVVVRNDEIPLAQLRCGGFDGVVISPGPGHPQRDGDFGACTELIREAEVPVLGVCLGHQGIATAFGGTVSPAPAPVHGQATEVIHGGDPMFDGVPLRFSAVRYHSLAATEPLPARLLATAWSEDGLLMALRHAERPVWGVQFHPESAGTPEGRILLRNFLALVDCGRPRSGPRPRSVSKPSIGRPDHRIVVRTLDHLPDPEVSFQRIFGADKYAFWLDPEQGGQATSQLSFMGSAQAPGGEVLTYDVGCDTVTRYRPGTERVDDLEGSIFEVLRRSLGEHRMGSGHPFGFAGGYVGYLGYELKGDLGSPNRHQAETPDACLMLATRLIVFDHSSGQTHAIRVIGPDVGLAEAEADAEWMRRQVATIPASGANGAQPLESSPTGTGSLEFALDREDYLAAVTEAQHRLKAGESYEVCLTNRIGVDLEGEVDPLALYLRLRRDSPAPHAAYLRFGELAILSASPESFLRIDAGGAVETKPIKGTRARAADVESDRALAEGLRTSTKDRAENMMVVDLLRNDLGRVCEVGSVTVERLMEVESYRHVHQLVSTIRGRLAAERDAIDCVQACFPGGSMTGAPKLRTMEIIDELEPCARGPYAGALGYFGLCGRVDLSIVIRSIVLSGSRASVGAGGAVTVLSDAGAEHEEMLLKAQPLVALLKDLADETGRAAAPLALVASPGGLE